MSQERSSSLRTGDIRATLSQVPFLGRVPPALAALLAVVALALVARVYELGARMAHQDEARVADWILHYMSSGSWEYRPIIHGPFLPHVNGVLFSVVGPNDFTMRLVVAVVGGVLPLSAWLFRAHLRDIELVSLGLLLAANPILLYYSRFMRNDVLLAAFMLFALGFFLRTIDTGKARYLFAGSACFALGFTTKELALVYPAYWVGGLALIVDHRLTLGWPPGSNQERSQPDGTPTATPQQGEASLSALSSRLGELRGPAARVLEQVWRWKLAVGVSVLEFLGILVVFYAPKGQHVEGPTLDAVFSNPLAAPAVAWKALDGSYAKFDSQWANSAAGHPYIPYFKTFGEVLAEGALVLCVLAVLGFLVDRYTGEQPSDLVSFAFYWGFASLLTYPAIVDNPFPWETVHIVVPLAIPAAAGLGRLVRELLSGYRSDDPVIVVSAAVLLLVAASLTGAAAHSTSFEKPQSPDNDLVQYAQPASDMKPVLQEIRSISATRDGVDVLYYGEIQEYQSGDVDYLLYSNEETWEPGGYPSAGWFSRLPLPWYFSRDDETNVSSTRDTVEARRSAAPVVITLANGTRGSPDNNAEDLDPYLEAYTRYEFQQYQYGRTLVFFVKNDTARGASRSG